MSKPAFCIEENKVTDQLRGNHAADLRLLFLLVRYYSQIRNFKPLVLFSGCTAGFVSDLAGHLEDRVSDDVAHFCFGPLCEYLSENLRK